MKYLSILLFIGILSGTAYGQAESFSKGDFVLNATVGIGSTLYSGRGYNTTLPALAISGEYGVVEDFITEKMTLGVGGYLGFAGSKYEVNDFQGNRYGYKYNYTIIGARGAVHYPFVDKLDTYAGVMLGFNLISFKEIGTAPLEQNPQSGYAVFSVYAGARYYFNPNVAVVGEIGYGIAWLNLGVAFKL